jgi:hypothetical protein
MIVANDRWNTPGILDTVVGTSNPAFRKSIQKQIACFKPRLLRDPVMNALTLRIVLKHTIS